jgi:hypothetical protein
MMLNPTGKENRIPHVKSVFPEYEMDDLRKEEDALSKASTTIVRTSIEGMIATNDASEYDDRDVTYERDNEEMESVMANPGESIRDDEHMSHDGAISYTESSMTKYLESSGITESPTNVPSIQPSRLAVTKMGSIAQKQKSRKSKAKSFVKTVKRFFVRSKKPPISTEINPVPRKPSIDVGSVAAEPLVNVDLQETPRSAERRKAKIGVKKVGENDQVLYTLKQEDSAAANERSNLYTNGIPGRERGTLTNGSSAGSTWGNGNTVTRRVEKWLEVVPVVEGGRKDGGFSTLMEISSVSDGKTALTIDNVKRIGNGVSRGEITKEKGEEAVNEDRGYIWTDLLKDHIPFDITPTPHGSIRLHRRPSIPAATNVIDVWYGLPTVQTWVDATQPWHCLHPKPSLPTFDDGSFPKGFGELGQMGGGQSDTSDDYSSTAGEDTDLKDWQGLVGISAKSNRKFTKECF